MEHNEFDILKDHISKYRFWYLIYDKVLWIKFSQKYCILLWFQLHNPYLKHPNTNGNGRGPAKIETCYNQHLNIVHINEVYRYFLKKSKRDKWVCF